VYRPPDGMINLDRDANVRVGFAVPDTALPSSRLY
jgi:hypothetical protein